MTKSSAGEAKSTTGYAAAVGSLASALSRPIEAVEDAADMGARRSDRVVVVGRDRHDLRLRPGAIRHDHERSRPAALDVELDASDRDDRQVHRHACSVRDGDPVIGDQEMTTVGRDEAEDALIGGHPECSIESCQSCEAPPKTWRDPRP
jgi:hypothetical protein